MKARLFFISILNFFLFTDSIEAETNNFSSTKATKYKIDTSIEKVETGLKSNDYKKICSESKNAAKLIRQNIHSLRKLEPDYNWSEIKEVLIETANNSCE